MSYKWISAGGSSIALSGDQWTTVVALLYPGSTVAAAGDEVKQVWVTAMCGDSTVGLELVVEDNMGNVLAGKTTTFGSTVQQLVSLTPVRAGSFRTAGPPQVLLLRARNTKPINSASPSIVGQLCLQLDSK
jgi:hypothetical protein